MTISARDALERLREGNHRFVSSVQGSDALLNHRRAELSMAQEPFAIILDNQVISAPNINEPILGGRASISGNFTVESANQLAIALRSGKLPVALRVIEESTVGPELGQDSIRAGVLASIVAVVLVVATIRARTTTTSTHSRPMNFWVRSSAPGIRNRPNRSRASMPPAVAI